MSFIVCTPILRWGFLGLFFIRFLNVLAFIDDFKALLVYLFNVAIW